MIDRVNSFKIGSKNEGYFGLQLDMQLAVAVAIFFSFYVHYGLLFLFCSLSFALPLYSFSSHGLHTANNSDWCPSTCPNPCSGNNSFLISCFKSLESGNPS